MPRGWWLHEVRRWECCGLRRTGGPSPGFGAFSSSPYTVPLCWVWGPGIAVLWICVLCDSVRLLFFFFSSRAIRFYKKKPQKRPAVGRAQCGVGSIER